MLKSFQREKGQELVEFALMFPLLAFLLFGIIEIGFIVFTDNTLSNAAREGARTGAVVPPPTPGAEATVAAAVRAQVVGLNVNQLTITTTRQGADVRVEVDYPVKLITGYIIEAFQGQAAQTRRGVYVMPIE